MTQRLDGAAKHPFGIARGRSFSETINIESVDWSNDTFSCDIKRYPDDPGEPLLSMDFSQPIYVGENTSFTISVSAEELDKATVPFSNLAGGDVELFYDIQRVSGGFKSTIMYGPFFVHGRSTK